MLVEERINFWRHVYVMKECHGYLNSFPRGGMTVLKTKCHYRDKRNNLYAQKPKMQKKKMGKLSEYMF